MRIVIKDNGRGISPEDLNRVWEPFFSKTVQHGGLGLGLSICRRILQEADGTIEIKSDLGHGTTVKISLPFVQKEKKIACPIPALSAAKIDLNLRPSVMIVDDNQLVLTLLARMLQNEYNVTEFMDARSALAAIETGKIPDVIISDIMMPEMDGQAFYEETRKLGSYSTRFLFITGGAVTEESLEFERKMAALGRLLLKPFEANQLRAALNKTLTLQGALEYEH